jgi:hypothetical protein
MATQKLCEVSLSLLRHFFLGEMGQRVMWFVELADNVGFWSTLRMQRV